MELLPKTPNVGNKCLLNSFLFCLRWTIIISCFGIVINGWILSIDKYMSGKTSTSLVVNETDQFLFPSITFCNTFKSAALYNILLSHSSMLLEQGETHFPENYFTQLMENMTKSRLELIDNLKDKNQDGNMVKKDAYWTTTMPSATTGMCHTYDPPAKSTSNTARIGFWLKYPSNLNTSSNKYFWLLQTQIFLHNAGKLLYYDCHGQEMPNNVWLDQTLLKKGHLNQVTIVYSKITSLDKFGNPCTSDESLSFSKCFEREMATKRGCQKPWQFFPEFVIEKCLNISDILELLAVENKQSSWSALERARISSCHLPCTNSISDLQYNALDDDVNDALAENDPYAVRANVAFKNFRFHYDEEYLVCDRTCLIGEIGGNFGFFLGGSILSMYDLAYYKLRYA